MKRERGPYRYRRLQMLDGADNDAYRPGGKPRGPTKCPRCGLEFRKGRWVRANAAAGAARRRCPACRRIEENFPAGYVTLSGEFFRARRNEVLARVRRCEAQEGAEHPLERIMRIDDSTESTLITTTSVHLAHQIGHALRKAFKGDLRVSYNKQDNLLRVRWQRPLD